MKLNQKGFTLVEIIAVVAMMTLLAGIAIPSVISAMNTSKEKSYKILMNDIVVASENLFQELDNGMSELYNYNEECGKETKITQNQSDNSITITLQTLVSNGFLNAKNIKEESCQKVLINPKTNENIGKCEIKITKEQDNFKIYYTLDNRSLEKEECKSLSYNKKIKENK